MNKLIALLSIVFLVSCTKNQRARQFGGKEEIKLQDHEILLNVTWKGNDMWFLTKDTITNEKYFRESSSWGVWNGQIIIK